jgi:hypothetical protein
MNKLYVFAIGGSGERVMNSLVMLLAAGMEVEPTIVPVFIDNDLKSYALRKSIELIEFYNSNTDDKKGLFSVCEDARIDNRDVTFCRAKIDKPIVLSKSEDGEAIGNLNNVIGVIKSEIPVQNEINLEKDLLFTSSDLNMPLNVGFIGNPNVGSVVMSCTSLNNKDFKGILKDAKSTDGIIVVGSLFGGTGASGIPLIVNKFLYKDEGANNKNDKPLIAGLSILPYFTFTEGDCCEKLKGLDGYDVDAKSFDSKTRAALIYYDQYMRGLDYLYYVGDGANKVTYPHKKGGSEQQNPAHVVELLSALSIIDFSKRKRTGNVIYKSPAWKVDIEEYEDKSRNKPEIYSKFLYLSGILCAELRKSLIKFQLMKAIFETDGMMNEYIRERRPFVRNIGFTNEILSGVIREDNPSGEKYWGLSHLFKEWAQWTNDLKCEINQEQRAFFLYNDRKNVDSAKINETITTLFYSSRDGVEKDFGIAKAESGFLFGTKPQDPEIIEELIDACRKAGDKTETIHDEMCISKMMSYLSTALDNVISKTCIN